MRKDLPRPVTTPSRQARTYENRDKSLGQSLLDTCYLLEETQRTSLTEAR
jgi:hypothetical protein